MSYSFISLAAQYDACVREGGDSSTYLVMTCDGPAFISRESRVRRVFDSIFHQYSFDITEVTTSLIKNVAFSLPSEGEIPSLFRVMGIAERMLKGTCREGEVSFKSLQRSFIYHTFIEAFDCIVERIARERGVAKLHVYLEYGYKKRAYTLIRDSLSIFGEDPSCLEDILKMAFERHDDSLILFLIQKKVPINGVRWVNPTYFHDLAKIAKNKGLDDVLAYFVREVAEVGDDKELYFQAVACGLFESVQAFIMKEGSLVNACDAEGNSSLHHAFLSKNVQLVQFLLKSCDPTVLNRAEETPLQHFLKKASSGGETKEFLRSILTRQSGEFQKSVSNVSELISSPLLEGIVCDCVEVFYLLRRPLSELSSFVVREDVEASLACISKRFPCADTDAFYVTGFVLNRDHLKTGCDRKTLSADSKSGAPLSDLEDLFSKLSWSSINIKKFYQEIFEVGETPEGDLLEKLKEQLQGFLQKVRSRKVYLGTPDRNPALEEFYVQIEVALTCCSAKLRGINRPEVTFSFFKEILTASRFCGSRYFQTSINLYLLICKEVEETPIGFFERLLADYRRICFEGVVLALNKGDVDAVIHATHDLGAELGIPGSSHTFNDEYSYEHYDKNEIKKIFFEKAYTPHSIVFYCVLQTCGQDAVTAEKYIDIQKELMPLHWNGEKFDPIVAALKKLVLIKDSGERIRQEDELLKKHGLARHDQVTAQEAIETARRVDYLETFVYTEKGKRSTIAIVYLLEKLGVLSSTLQWGDSSRIITPLAKRESYKKIPLGSLFSRLRGFFKKYI